MPEGTLCTIGNRRIAWFVSRAPAGGGADGPGRLYRVRAVAIAREAHVRCATCARVPRRRGATRVPCVFNIMRDYAGAAVCRGVILCDSRTSVL